MQENIRIFGLIGNNISYSFSNLFFNKKFKKEGIKNTNYKIFDVKSINDAKNILYNTNFLYGVNITIPYKEKIISSIDHLSLEAEKIKAVNTIKIINKQTIGYNTDIYGFEKSFIKNIKNYHNRALVLGTGGAAKAIKFVLEKLKIHYISVSRNSYNNNILLYNDINYDIMQKYNIIINCTPIGTYPLINDKPNIPYKYLTSSHYLYDLVYNPYITSFLKEGIKKKCTIQNGLNMLYLQANKSWILWNSK